MTANTTPEQDGNVVDLDLYLNEQLADPEFARAYVRQLEAQRDRLYMACRRMLDDLEHIINPMLAKAGMHPLDLSVNDLRDALSGEAG